MTIADLRSLTMPVINSGPLQHEIGLEKENEANVPLLPQPASETESARLVSDVPIRPPSPPG
jgi:hypothetical protein